MLKTKTLDSVETTYGKDVIEFYLLLFGPEVEVVGSKITEEGYTLILEGPEIQVNTLLEVLGQSHESNH